MSGGKPGQEVDLPILIAHGEQGKAYVPDSFGNCFGDRCCKLGLGHCSSHGLRKAGARRLAEHGATAFEVMAFLAYRTAKKASRHVAAANRTTLTTSGMAKLDPKREQDLSNLSKRLDNGAT